MQTRTDASQSPIDDTERGLAMLAHGSSLIAMLLSAGFLTFAGPLVVWLVAGERRPFARHAASRSFNFTLSMYLIFVVSMVVAVIAGVGGILGAGVGVGGVGLLVGIGALLVGGVALTLQFVCHIIAIFVAAQGNHFRYPFCLRVLPG